MRYLKVSDWQEEFNKALEYRRRFGLESRWAELEALLYNVEPTQANAGPNILISTLDALSSALLVPNPYVTVKARKSDWVTKARLQESVDNMLIDMMDMPTELAKGVYSAFLWGRGIFKIGYDSEFGYDDTLDLGLQEPLGLTGSMYDRKGTKRLEFNDFQPGMPWFKNVLPHDFLVPWGTYDVKDASWCAHRVVRHIDAIRADLKYDQSVAKKIQPNMSMQDFVKSYQSTIRPYRAGRTENLTSNWESKDAEYVELWEIRDRCTNRIMVMATGYDDGWLRNEPDLLQVAGLPFVTMGFVPRVRSFWTTSDAFLLRYHQAELSDIAIQTTKNRRLQIVKFAYQTGMIDEDQLDRALSSDVGAAFKVNGPLQDSIQPFNFATPNMQLYQDAAVVRENAREQVGFSKNQIGEYEVGGRRTAREVMEVAQSSGLRLDRRQNEVRRVYCEAFKIINRIIHENWKLPRLVEVVGEDGLPEWHNVTGDDLRGEYNYRLGFSIGGNESLAERRQTAMQLYQMMSQDPRFDPIATAQWLSRAINDPEFSATFAGGILNGQGQQGSVPSGGGTPFGGGQAVGMGGVAAGAQEAPAGGGQ